MPSTGQFFSTFKYVPSVQLVILQSGVWTAVYCQTIFQSLSLSTVVTSSVYSLRTVMAAEMALADSKGHIGPDQLVEQQKRSLSGHPHCLDTICGELTIGNSLTCSSHHPVLAVACHRNTLDVDALQSSGRSHQRVHQDQMLCSSTWEARF